MEPPNVMSYWTFTILFISILLYSFFQSTAPESKDNQRRKDKLPKLKLPNSALAKLKHIRAGKSVGLETTPKLRVEDWHRTLSRTYDKDEGPEENVEKPTLVNISIWIIKIYSVSETDMSYQIDFYLQEMWRDQRLAFDKEKFGNKTPITIPAAVLPKLWHPDTFFPNARSVKESNSESITHSQVFKLSDSGSVWFSRRLILNADCPMDLTYYPFDTQACKLNISSYGSNTKHVIFQWRSNPPPVEIEKITFPEFRITKTSTRSKILNFTSGNYSSIGFCFILERRYGYCLIQMILPGAAVVMSSWVALWLEEETQFQDVIAVIVAIIFLSYANNSVMPRVSYVKLMDVYLGICFLFTFISLVKLVLLKYIQRRWERKNNEPESGCTSNTHKVSVFSWNDFKNSKHYQTKSHFRWVSCCHISTQLLIPLTYAIFMVGVLIIIPNYIQNKGICD